MNLAIRSVAEADRDNWQSLFDAYAAFYKTEVLAGVHDAVWGWIFDPAEAFWCDVAEAQDGTLLGFAQYQLMQRSLSGNKVCYMSDLFVRPDARGSGAGRALIDHVISFARTNGISNLRWLTQEFNYDARRLYDSFTARSDFVLYSIPLETP
tara:strand:- start:11235 stop:11690 length:456 start_codon:yes stop_codon:yes gene_type:complete